MTLAVLALALPAAAWETDQLSDRGAPLADLTPLADERLRVAIGEAIRAVNREVGCEATAQTQHARLAQEVHDRVGRADFVAGRGTLRGRGYNSYGAWVEELGVVDWPPPDDHLYADLRLWQAPLLHLAGVCSTVRLAGQRVGVDKLDHFLGMGFYYWKHSREGEDPDAAIRWGTRTERTVYGSSTTLAFSFADLAANLDGYHFYARLLDPLTGVARRGAGGCLEEAHPFTWADWIDWRYDEVLNPPVYRPTAARAVQRRLESAREQTCQAYAVWGGADYQVHLARILAAPDPAVRGEAPARVDPYRLDELCAGAEETGPAARSSSLRRRAQVREGSTRSTRS